MNLIHDNKKFNFNIKRRFDKFDVFLLQLLKKYLIYFF